MMVQCNDDDNDGDDNNDNDDINDDKSEINYKSYNTFFLYKRR